MPTERFEKAAEIAPADDLDADDEDEGEATGEVVPATASGSVLMGTSGGAAR